MEKSFAFRSSRFIHSGPINEDSNAGNMFYGEDVAKHLSKHLGSQPGLSSINYVDEDWGWLVEGKFHEFSFDLPIYNIRRPDADSEVPNHLAGTNEWVVGVVAYRQQKFLWLIPTRKKIEPPTALLDHLKAVLEDAGATEIALKPGIDQD
jgi:hypothetical protein